MTERCRATCHLSAHLHPPRRCVSCGEWTRSAGEAVEDCEALEALLRREFWNPDNGGQWPRIADALLAAGISIRPGERA